MLVLESALHAERRGALPPTAWLLGDGWSCDAHHPTAPEPQGQQIRRAMRAAIEGSGSDADAIGCVIPHGTGTALNDVVESRALHAVIGPRCARLPLYSLKALVGHTGGAAGALAAVTGALIARRRAVPPNAPLDEPDPDCPVWLPDGGPTPLTGRHVLVNAYAFGGNNVSFVLAGGDPR
nr:hypothetical protein [Streptomyces cupreus]